MSDETAQDVLNLRRSIRLYFIDILLAVLSVKEELLDKQLMVQKLDKWIRRYSGIQSVMEDEGKM